jgi:hypothetical protein
MAAGGRCFDRKGETNTENCAELRVLAGTEGNLSRALADPETLTWLSETWWRRKGSASIRAND